MLLTIKDKYLDLGWKMSTQIFDNYSYHFCRERNIKQFLMGNKRTARVVLSVVEMVYLIIYIFVGRPWTRCMMSFGFVPGVYGEEFSELLIWSDACIYTYILIMILLIIGKSLNPKILRRQVNAHPINLPLLSWTTWIDLGHPEWNKIVWY